MVSDRRVQVSTLMVALGLVEAAYGLWTDDLVFAAFGAFFALLGVAYYWEVWRLDD